MLGQSRWSRTLLRGSMTSYTETTSKQTETINSIDYATGWQYSVSGTNVSNNGAALLPPTTTNNVTVTPLGGIEGTVSSSASSLNFNNSNFTITNPGQAFQFTTTYQGKSGNYKSDYYPKNNGGYKRNRHYKYLYPIALCLTNLAIAPATLAADVGGVSATANPMDLIHQVQSPTKIYPGFTRSPTSLTHMEEESVAKGIQLQTSLHTLLMPQMIRIHLKLSTWNLSMTTETLKVAW